MSTTIPIGLKIVAVLLALWALGSSMAVKMRFKEGLPLFGNWVSGPTAAATVVLLDIVGPIAFLYALWFQLVWGLFVAKCFIGCFVLNSIVAFFTFREKLGTKPIAIPASIYFVFLLVIVANGDYFVGGED